jgi:hypothetical protein
MKLRRSLIFFFSLILLGGCALDDGDGGVFISSDTFYFNESQHGWAGDFAGYAVEDSVESQMYFGYEDLPSNLATNQKALMLSGKNVGESLSMFVKKKITGLTPNTQYTLVYDIILATNVHAGTPSGDSVKITTGAFNAEPVSIKAGDYYQLETGPHWSDNLFDIGSIGNTNVTDNYDYVSRGNGNSAFPFITVTTNAQGELWLYIGTESTYSGATTVYITYVRVIFSTSM